MLGGNSYPPRSPEYTLANSRDPRWITTPSTPNLSYCTMVTRSTKSGRAKRARIRATKEFLRWKAAARKRAHRTKDAPQVVADSVRRAKMYRARKAHKQSPLQKDQIEGVLDALRHLRATRLRPLKSSIVFVVLDSYDARAAYSTQAGAEAYIEGRTEPSGYRLVRVPLDKAFRGEREKWKPAAQRVHHVSMTTKRYKKVPNRAGQESRDLTLPVYRGRGLKPGIDPTSNLSLWDAAEELGERRTSVDIIESIKESLTAITKPRFFQSERGFQGELLVQLSRRLRLSDREVVEQEYQKRQRDHGLTVRPDIIIHEPFDSARHGARTAGNRVVVEIKINATEAEAVQDFESLAAMIQVLHYPLGVFINVGSSLTHANLVPRTVRGRIVTFAVERRDGRAHVVEERT